MMLEFDDIQHILLTRAPAMTGRYEFLSFRNPAGARAWLAAILERIHSAKAMRESVEKDKRWVTVAFTRNGLRALGVDEASLATFPEEFRQGMVARAEMLGDTGRNHPSNWTDKTSSPDLHAIVILFARDAAERGRCVSEHAKLIGQCEAWKFFPPSIWTRRRRLSTRTTISGIATAFRNRSLKARAMSPCRVPADR